MIRKTVAGVLLVLAIFVTARAEAGWEFKYTVETVVRINATNGQESWSGTGVCYEYRDGVAYILTAGHVVDGARRLDFEVFTNTSWPNPVRTYKSPVAVWYSLGKGGKKEYGRDIAMIGARIWVPRKAPLAAPGTTVTQGQVVSVLGCPGGDAPVARLTTVKNDIGGMLFYEKDMGKGSSGGPVFNQNGYLIAINVAGSPGSGIAVNREQIEKLFQAIARAK
jgi:S1-C subfamily serine protease